MKYETLPWTTRDGEEKLLCVFSLFYSLRGLDSKLISVGLPLGSPDTSSYFSDPLHKNDLYSISFSFVPKKDLPTQHLVWGNDFDHPVRDRLPPGFNTAFKIVKSFIDPGLECDAYADEPWLYGPALSCWFKFRIGDQQQQIEQAKNSGSSQSMDDDHYVVHEGADGTGSEARNGLPEDAEKRRKYFLDVSHRGKFSFERGRLYEADFHNPYLDFASKSGSSDLCQSRDIISLLSAFN